MEAEIPSNDRNSLPRGEIPYREEKFPEWEIPWMKIITRRDEKFPEPEIPMGRRNSLT